MQDPPVPQVLDRIADLEEDRAEHGGCENAAERLQSLAAGKRHREVGAMLSANTEVVRADDMRMMESMQQQEFRLER